MYLSDSKEWYSHQLCHLSKATFTWHTLHATLAWISQCLDTVQRLNFPYKVRTRANFKALHTSQILSYINATQTILSKWLNNANEGITFASSSRSYEQCCMIKNFRTVRWRQTTTFIQHCHSVHKLSCRNHSKWHPSWCQNAAKEASITHARPCDSMTVVSKVPILGARQYLVYHP